MTEKISSTVESVKIELDGRYIIILKLPSHIRSKEEANRHSKYLQSSFDDWWASGEKFGTIVIDGGADIKVERID